MTAPVTPEDVVGALAAHGEKWLGFLTGRGTWSCTCGEMLNADHDEMRAHVAAALMERFDIREPGEVAEGVAAVQHWMASDLQSSLGYAPNINPDPKFTGLSWADWWAQLNGEVRSRAALDGPALQSSAQEPRT